jgi:pimeloyl-ACP methyl ester carboxylesterase
MVRLMDCFSEQTFTFGQDRRLVGVVALPRNRSDSRAVAVVILNTGIVHRVGHGRMYVDLARRLATHGHVVLRFDFSGLGDSGTLSDAQQPLEAGRTDIREAIDFLQAQCNVDRVVVMGLCSGANFAVLYGGTDARVDGVIAIDPLVPRTLRYYVLYYTWRLLKLSTWNDLLAGRHPMWTKLATALGRPQGLEERTPSDGVNAEIRAMLENAYSSIVEAKKRILAIYTAGMQHQHCYREQMLDAFPNVQFGSSTVIEYLNYRDHTFMYEESRNRLFEIVSDWLANSGKRVLAGERSNASAHSEDVLQSRKRPGITVQVF